MQFSNCDIHATPFIRGTCKCGVELIEVPNGFLSRAMYCQNCENVYELKMVKIPVAKVSVEFIEQCRKHCKRKEPTQ